VTAPVTYGVGFGTFVGLGFFISRWIWSSLIRLPW
jgi:hypothetical protein